MLFYSDEKWDRIHAMVEAAGKGDPEQAARKLIEYCPDFPTGWMLLGAAAKAPKDSEAALWKAMSLAPCRESYYLALADFLTAQDEADPLPKHLRLLALWKLSLLDAIPKYIADSFQPTLGAEALEPETYELMARAQEAEFAKAPALPNIELQLRPYQLLNRLQRESSQTLNPTTLDGILRYRDECEPLFRSALQEWAQSEGALDENSFCFLVAVLGEIAGPDFAPDLLELINWGKDADFSHIQWALHRLAQRHPEPVIQHFQAAALDDLATRCGIAEHLLVMPRVAGDVVVLESLLKGYEDATAEGDMGQFLLSVVAALVARGQTPLARKLARQYGSLLNAEERQMLAPALDGELVPMLVQMDIVGQTIQDICFHRSLMDEDDLEEELDQDELEEELDILPPPKPGANEPCWCGSSQKYKKCHRAADEEAARVKSSAPPKAAPVSLHADITKRVADASREWHKESDIRRAKKMFFGDSGRVEATGEEIDRFMQWLMHDYRDPVTRQSSFANFLRTRGPKLSAAERELVQSLRDARFGIFEVERVEPGSGVHVRDLFAGDRMFVHDVSSSHELQRWDCILTRIQYYQGRWIFAGNGMMLPRNVLGQVREFVERESRAAKQTAADYVRDNSHRMPRLVTETVDRKLAGIRVVNNEGEEVSFGKSEYAIVDRAALIEKLRSLEELEEGESDPSGNPWFTWLQPLGNERRPLGHLEIENGTLRLETMSRTRLETLRGLVEFHAAGLVQHRQDQYTSVEDIKDKVRSGQAAPPERPPSAAEHAIIEQALAQHYAGWADTKLPALGGKTARQALRSRAGREAVIELLRTMDNSEQHKARKGEPSFDFNIIRRDLGLPEE